MILFYNLLNVVKLMNLTKKFNLLKASVINSIIHLLQKYLNK